MKMFHIGKQSVKSLKSVSKYLIELLIVSFGVFLGFYLGEQNNQKRTNQNTLNALNQIISELESNVEIIGRTITYHEQLSIELDSVTSILEKSDYNKPFLETKEKFNFSQMPSWRGYWVANTNSIIYESAKISGVFNELNIETIRIIATVYEFQEHYKKLGNQSLNKLLDMDSDTKVMDVVGLLERLVKYDLYAQEKSILEMLKQSIQQLKKIRDEKSYRK